MVRLLPEGSRRDTDDVQAMSLQTKGAGSNPAPSSIHLSNGVRSGSSVVERWDKAHGIGCVRSKGGRVGQSTRQHLIANQKPLPLLMTRGAGLEGIRSGSLAYFSVTGTVDAVLG